MHTKGAGQLVRRVAHQREAGFADSRRGLVPHLVGEVSVGGDDVDLRAQLLELGIVVGCVFYFGGAVEGESCRHEDEGRPLTLQTLFAYFDEFAVVESLCLERCNFGIDE